MGQRPKDLTPHENLRHYWGAELRALRLARGLSLSELGALVHNNPSYLAKIERAERPATAMLAESCDRVLQAQGALVRLHALAGSGRELAEPTPERTPADVASEHLHVAGLVGRLADGARFPATPDVGEEIVVPARTPDGRLVFVSVPRRVVLQGLGSVALGLTATSATVPSVAVPSAALPSADIDPIEHFRQLRQVLIENDALFGPRHVIPLVREQIGIMQQLRSNGSGADQHELVRTQARYTQFCGALHSDTGENDLAESCVDRALGLSQMAGDHSLTVYVLACKAQLAGDMRVATDAIGAAEQALRMSAPRSRTAAVAATFAGHGHALSGDHAATERSYDAARELLDTAEDDPDDPCRTWYLDDNRIALHRARSLTALGDYHRAAQSYQGAVAEIPSRYRRSRGVWLARASRALTGDQQVEHAASMGLDALAIGAVTGSARTLTELVHLNRELAPWNTVPAVADFRTALKDTLSQPA